jgi:hypothetical protein
MTAFELIQDALSRIVAARESLEFGDAGEANQILFDLEIDLQGAIERGGFE